MKTRFSKKHLSAVIAASLALEAIPSMAAQLEEVIVTARKRDESIMQVPTTAAVLSQQTLDEYAIGDVKGIAEKVPGLNFSDGPLSSGVMISMRGVGSGSNNPGIDQSVALVADGVQFTQGLAYKAATFDLAQVEVLKGPQALFFGKAAPAGVISIRTADPTDELEARLRAGYEFEAEEQLGEFVVSGPVTDTLGLRLAAQFSDMDGYFENDAVPGTAINPAWGSLGAAPVTEQDFPNEETLLLRGTALWNPTDRLHARLKVNYSDSDIQGNGGEPQLVSCPDGTNSVFHGLGIDWIGSEDCKLDDKQKFAYMDPAAFPFIVNGGVPFSEAEQYFGSLELNYDVGNDLTLTSVTGFYDVDQKSMMNLSITSDFGTPMANQGHMERNDFTQELRLTSDYDGTLNFMVGGFYQDGETNYLSWLPANQTLVVISPRFRLPAALTMQDNDLDAETVSAFGQVLWQITSELELGVGTRWTGEDREHSVVDRFPELSGGTAVPVNTANPKLGSDTWSPEISLTYTATDNLTFFGNLKRAYKSGSYDVTSAKPGDDKSFADEKVEGGEVGLKSRWLDDSLAVNLSGYAYKYDDLQIESRVFDPANGIVGVRTVNAASADVYGVDLDVTYVPPGLEGLTLYGAVNWNEAEYDEFPNAQCWLGQTLSQGCNVDFNGDKIGDAQDLAGEPLLRAPEWTANFGFDYAMSVFDDMTLRFGSNTNYSDSYSASSTNFGDAYMDSYTKTSANIGLVGPDERWQVEVIGDNLTDEFVYGGCAATSFADNILVGQSLGGTGTANGGPGKQPETACYVERGRSVWLRLTWNL
jgi:outer membrane receptor protein involved in Fe transport